MDATPVDANLNTSFLPLNVDETLEGFRVDGTMGVRALVRELIAARALVTLFAEEDPETFIITRLLGLEADSLEFDFSGGDDQRLQALLDAPYLTVVGVPGSVKIQFRIADLERVPSAPQSGATLTAPLPSQGWRVQRRNAFRVQPPLADQATVAFRMSSDAEVKGRLTDLSVGGLATTWQADLPEPALGSLLRHCRIEAGHIAPIPCDLRVVRVDRAPAGQSPRISCEFHAMPQTVARFVQLYVMDIEKRARLASRAT